MDRKGKTLDGSKNDRRPVPETVSVFSVDDEVVAAATGPLLSVKIDDEAARAEGFIGTEEEEDDDEEASLCEVSVN